MNFCTFWRLKFTKWAKFTAPKMAKTADFALPEYSKLISRQISVIQKSWNFHNVKGDKDGDNRLSIVEITSPTLDLKNNIQSPTFCNIAPPGDQCGLYVKFAASLPSLTNTFPSEQYLGIRYTVWKVHDFSVIQILREINFGESRRSKTAVLAIIEALKMINMPAFKKC